MRGLFLFPILMLSSELFATVKVVATTTDVAWAAKQIGGELVEVSSLLNGENDPHYVEATPSFALKAANAELVCAVGLDLEAGWLPRVLQRSANAAVQPGAAGYCELGRSIRPRGLPQGKLDRSMGHVHAKGNPHFWLAPETFAKGAIEIKRGLQRVDSEHKMVYEQRYNKFVARMNSLQQELRNLARGQRIRAIQYHEEFSYYLDALAIAYFGAIEEKPGLPPSAARIAQVAVKSRDESVGIILATPTTPKNILKKLQGLNRKLTPIIFQVSLATPSDDYELMLRELTRKILATQNISKEQKKQNDLRKG